MSTSATSESNGGRQPVSGTPAAPTAGSPRRSTGEVAAKTAEVASAEVAPAMASDARPFGGGIDILGLLGDDAVPGSGACLGFVFSYPVRERARGCLLHLIGDEFLRQGPHGTFNVDLVAGLGFKIWEHFTEEVPGSSTAPCLASAYVELVSDDDEAADGQLVEDGDAFRVSL